MTDRSSQYKNEGKDANVMRKNRAEQALTLRKAKREEIMAKRRNIPQESEQDLQEAAALESVSMEELVVNAKSQDPKIRLQAIIRVRKMLSSSRTPPIDEIVNSGILPILVDGLRSSDANLQFESAWALTNIASGTSEQTCAVVNAGAIPHFMNLLGSNNAQVCEQAIWALGNIIGDGPHFRDYCIELGIVEPLVSFVRPDVPLEFLRNVAWVLVNLVRSKDSPLSPRVYELILPSLVNLVHCKDDKILTDTAWAIAYICDTGNEGIQMIINSGLLEHIIPLLIHEESRISSVALRCVGNIATGTNEQTQALLDRGILQYMGPLLLHKKSKISKGAVWFVSNITAGTESQIQAVIDANLLPIVVDLLIRGDFLTQKEAAWAVSNVAVLGTVEQVLYLFESGAVKPLCDLLGIGDVQIIQVILDALFNILKKLPDHYSQISQVIEECGGLEKIEQLQNHGSDQIYKLAYDIIDEFFTDAEANKLDEGQGFKFEKSREPFDQYKF